MLFCSENMQIASPLLHRVHNVRFANAESEISLDARNICAFATGKFSAPQRSQRLCAASHEIRCPIRWLHLPSRRNHELRSGIVEKEEAIRKFQWPRLAAMLCSETSVFQPIRVWGVVSAELEVKRGNAAWGRKNRHS